ncbi:unnamed protein product, partial [marine sediment metagenome]
QAPAPADERPRETKVRGVEAPTNTILFLTDAVTPLLYLLVLLASLLELLVVILAEIGPLTLDVQARRLCLGEGDGSDGFIVAAGN